MCGKNPEWQWGGLYSRTPGCFQHIYATNVIVLLLSHVGDIYKSPSANFPGSKTVYLGMFSSPLSKSGIFLFVMKQGDSECEKYAIVLALYKYYGV